MKALTKIIPNHPKQPLQRRKKGGEMVMEPLKRHRRNTAISVLAGTPLHLPNTGYILQTLREASIRITTALN